jgi:hypothetical protein
LAIGSDSESRVRAAIALLAILILAGCAERDLWPAERLDPKTAVNVTIMARPWIYARGVPMLAANARDYLNVGVVETNRGGTRAYWLGVVSWSTIDRSVFAASGAGSAPARVRLGWPKSSLEFSPATGGRTAAGLSSPAFVEPGTNFQESWYALSIDQVVQLGRGAPVSVSLAGEGGELTTYEAWDANPAAMLEFLKATGLDGP